MSRWGDDGALPTVRQLCALIVKREGKYVLLDVETADLLEADVAILNDRMWRKMANLSALLRAKRCVIEIGRGRVQVRGYTQLGIVEAIGIVCTELQEKRLSALLQLIGKAFAMKEAES